MIHINILVKNADGQNRLGTVENIVTGNEHISEKCPLEKGENTSRNTVKKIKILNKNKETIPGF